MADDAADVKAYDKAKREDDGTRSALDDLRADHEELKEQERTNGQAA